MHQVKEFSPRISLGCSISSYPYLKLAMLDHPAQFRRASIATGGAWRSTTR